MYNKIQLCIVTFYIACNIARGYPNGAPIDICDTLSPMKTSGLPLQNSDAPYELLQTSVSFKPGQVINVNIQRINAESSFEGFMVQAIEKMSGRYVGRFLDADGLHLIDECSAVMQYDNQRKTGVQLAWVAPLNQRGDVIFRGTIVEKKTRYYDNLISRLELQK